jgi:hypothetical protein
VPTSHPESRQVVRDYVESLSPMPRSVVDVGAGEGTYFDLLHSVLPGAHFSAIEIWAPYVEQYGLEAKYHEVLVGDLGHVDLGKWAPDLVIFGDVLEHLPFAQATAKWIEAGAAKHRIAVVPLGWYPQGSINGNPHETHLAMYTADSFLENFPGSSLLWSGDVVGVFVG